MGKFLSGLWSKLLDNAVLLTAGAIGTVLFFVWNHMSTFVHDQITGTIARVIDDDLKDADKSALLGKFRNAVMAEIQSKKGSLSRSIEGISNDRIAEQFGKMFGEMTVGLLILTQDNSQGLIHLVDPPLHSGSIFVRIENLPDGAQIWFQGPRRPVPVKVAKLGEYRFSINDLLCENVKDNKCVQDTTMMDPSGVVEPASTYFHDMYTITVKLVRPAGNGAERVEIFSPVIVKYMVVVYPPLNTDELR